MPDCRNDSSVSGRRPSGQLIDVGKIHLDAGPTPERRGQHRTRLTQPAAVLRGGPDNDPDRKPQLGATECSGHYHRTLNTPIDNSVYFVRLLDTTTGQTLKQCVSGTVCETSVSSATLVTHTYVAHLDRGRGGPPPYPIVSASPAIRVIWGPPIRLTVPHLTFAAISFHTNDEDKDHDTNVTVDIYAKNQQLVASGVIGLSQRFADNEDDGPFNLTTLDPSVTMSSLHGGSVRVVIKPYGDDTWRFNFNTRINFSDGGSLSVGRVGVQMSEEHEAYSWPIP